MNTTMNEAIEFIEENDVKFIRLAFCDITGLSKNVSIMPNELLSAFNNGVSIDGSAVLGFSNVKSSDLLIFPDPSTLSVLPWRPGPGRVVRFYCDIKKPDGTLFLNDGRQILKKAIEQGRKLGINFKVGIECEFYLFKLDDEGEVTKTPLDKGGYMDIAPLDKGENIRREICFCLEEMGIYPETSHHEQGPGQNEVDFVASDALSSCDNILIFKSVVKAIAARNGLFASFMPKPLEDKPGSGMHINVSINKDGVNLLSDLENSKLAQSFIAGILEKSREISIFLNPTINSYNRLGNFEAPSYISWAYQNRSQLIRIPAGTQERSRIELRSPDSSANPYFALASILYAGLYGIEKNLELMEKVDEDLFNAQNSVLENLKSLPKTLKEAITCARDSEFLSECITADVLNTYIKCKENEVLAHENATDKSLFFDEYYFIKY